MGHWIAEAECADGTTIYKTNFCISGSIRQDNQEQYNIECALIEWGNNHGGCTWYSVTYVEED